MLNKNKLMALLLIMIMAVSVMVGCAKQEEQPQPQQQAAEKQPEPKKEVILATTTSTVDSGLLDVLQPELEKQTGYQLNIISVGSGQAIAMAEKGEADALLVHSPKDEKKIEASGVVINRQLVMHNDFLLVGPANDPAKIKGKKIEEAFKSLADSKALFVSRGDNSGTHKKELGIWEKINIKPAGTWYQETGTGMGQTLNVAAEKAGYTLTDRATYLALKDKINLGIIAEGDKALLNIYHAMQVNPEKFNKVNIDGSKAFVDFMVAATTQEMIKSFGMDKFGESLFIPDAGKSEAEIAK
ncbi:MAG: substrate-binding domain-containing protein [Carboxydocellales bacterium]